MLRRASLTLLSFAFFVLATGVIIQWGTSLGSNIGPMTEGNRAMSLVRPVFAQQGSFLEAEAGFAAWTRVQGTFNLDLARRAFKTLDADTGNYLAGEVEVTFSGATSNPHVYSSQAGWLVAYYFRDQPAGAAWYTDAVKPPNNFLAMALRDVAAAAGVTTPFVNYYHFGYPLANKILVIHGNGATEMMIPSDVLLYEASVSNWSRIYVGSRYLRGNYIKICEVVLPPEIISDNVKMDSFQSFDDIVSSLNRVSFGNCNPKVLTIALTLREP